MNTFDPGSHDEVPLPHNTGRRTNQLSTDVDTEPRREMSSSPHVTFETIHDDGHHDDASFGLYNSSFDTLSDAGAALSIGVDDSLMVDTANRNSDRTPNTGGNRMFASSGLSQVPGPNDIDLPELNSAHDNLASGEISLGDLSPIKLVYSEGSPPILERQVASYPIDTFRNEGSSDFDWKNDDINHVYTSNRSNPFYVLRSASRAFSNVRYLLPCLQSPQSDSNTVTMSNYGNIRQYKGVMENEDRSIDLSISIRRVESAICAFGGTLRPSRAQFIDDSLQNEITVTAVRATYADKNHSPGRRTENSFTHNVSNSVAVNTKNDQLAANDHSRKGSQNSSAASSDGASQDPSKLKYRCKRCGQLKQNHICPYQQPLQRSIGVMVYPAVNSYNAAEPGVIAPSLSKMNNFISYDDSDQGGDPPSDHVTQQHPKVDDRNPFIVHGATVTPESLRGAFRGDAHFHSPQSSLSAQSSDDPVTHHLGPLNSSISKHDTRRLLKRPHGHMIESSMSPCRYESIRSAPFVASVSLRPEQYRAVTPFTKAGLSKRVAGGSASIADGTVAPVSTSTAPITTTATTKVMYHYPAVALSFAERKRMSDTLFHLSQEIPTVTSDCATILRLARQNNEWDIAVAELLTQVVVALYCGEGDVRLDGLQQYLLSIGVSC